MGALEGKGTREARAGSVIGAVCRRGRALGARIARFPTLPCPLGQSRARKRCLSFVFCSALAFPLSRRRFYLTLSVLPFPPLSSLSLSLTHTSPSQAHCYLLLLLIVLLLITTPSLTASLSTLLRSTCIFRSHLPLLLSTSPAADDNSAERLRRCSPLISIHPVRRRTHPRTHARTRLRTAPHVHTHFDLVTITPATGHRLHRSSHPRYTTRRRERLPFCAASSTTLASRPDDQSTSGRQDNKEPLGLTSSFGGNLRQRLCIVAAAGTGISKERYFFVIS